MLVSSFRNIGGAAAGFWRHFWNRAGVLPMPDASISTKSVSVLSIGLLGSLSLLGSLVVKLFGGAAEDVLPSWTQETLFGWPLICLTLFVTWMVLGYIIVKAEPPKAKKGAKRKSRNRKKQRSSYVHPPFSRFLAKVFLSCTVIMVSLMLLVGSYRSIACALDPETVLVTEPTLWSGEQTHELESRGFELSNYVQPGEVYAFVQVQVQFRNRCDEKPPKDLRIELRRHHSLRDVTIAWMNHDKNRDGLSVQKVGHLSSKNGYVYDLEGIQSDDEVKFVVLLRRPKGGEAIGTEALVTKWKPRK